MTPSNQTTPIRDLMPKGYLPKIAEMTGVGRSNICIIVRDELISSKIWPAIEKLAKEKNADAYEARIAFLNYRRAYASAA